MSIFENGLSWILYTDMESNFLKFLEYVPYVTNHKKVYSPKLLSLLLQIGGYVDTVFKEMAKFNGFNDNPACQELNEAAEKEEYGITYARKAFEILYHLSSNNKGNIISKLPWLEIPESLTPFKEFNQRRNKSPEWWIKYNKVKHDWSKWIADANLENALDGLAGAFLLNATHYPSQKFLWKKGILKLVYYVGKKAEESRIPEFQFDEIMEFAVKKREPLSHPFVVESPLFLYEYPRSKYGTSKYLTPVP